MRPMVRPSMRPASRALQSFIAVLVVALARPPVARAASAPELLAEVTLGASAPRIAVVVVSQDLRASQQQGALEGSAEAALDRAARFTVISVHDAFNPSAAKKQDERLEDSRANMKAGKQALDDLDTVKATDEFTKALQALQESDLSRNFPALLEAWTMKAAGHATGGENGPAKKDIESVVALSPKAEFSPTYFAPDLIKFAEAQRKFAANAKGELLVRTEPAGARVWVDGTYRGVSPVTVAGLTGQKHFIAAAAGGYALAQGQSGPGEEVLSLASAEIGPGWKKAITAIKADPEGSTRDSAAQTLGKAAQLDQVLLVVAKKSLAGERLDLIGIRLDVKDGHNVAYRSGTVSPGDPEQLATFFDGLTGKDARRDGKDPVHHFKGGGGGGVKTIAGISLLGAGGVALIVGGVFGIMAAGQVTVFHQTPQTQLVNSANVKKDGQTFAAVADISYLVGILAAGTGGVLLLTHNAASDEDVAQPGKKGGGSDDAKRRELDRKAAEDRRAAEERAKEDERRRDEERKRDEDRKKDGDSDDKRKTDAEEARKAEDEARKQKEDEDAPKKLSRKEQAALEKKKREEEKEKAAEDKKRAEEEERAKKAEEKKGGKLTKKQQREEEERQKREEEEKAAKQKADEEAKKQAEADARKKKEADERKKKEDAEKKKKTEDHDDLRNF